MTLLNLFLLAVIQGVTEFLPISSSGHLALFPHLSGYQDQGLFLDVAVHVGTLVAVCGYFFKDLKAIFADTFAWPRQGPTANSRLFVAVAVGTIPVVVAGLLLKLFFDMDLLRQVPVIAATTIIFGILLYVADQYAPNKQTLEKLGLKHAVLIGLAQIMALIPGTSRSGVTMTAARALGYTRTESARFSMLLSIPTILAALVLLLADLPAEQLQAQWQPALIAAVFAFVSAYAAIFLMMRWLQQASMTIFVVYRLVLGVGLLIWWYA